jgi:hypothetical protein
VHDGLALVHVVRQAAWAASTYGNTAVRVALRGNRLALGGHEERLVFVVGSPRSGTTFVGESVGSQPGFVDLGEVPLLKAAVAELAPLPDEEQGLRVRRILERVRRLGFVRRLRGVEQTPEMSYLLPGALQAYPDATAVHILRDGRDVVCSLLERGWLSARRSSGSDDANQPYGVHARFWVEPERREEFAQVSDARRAAWAWRRYVTAARAVPERTVELRYEALVADPTAAADAVTAALGAAPGPLRTAFSAVHGNSVGRWRRELSAEQLADVEAEAGGLLAELGYG